MGNGNLPQARPYLMKMSFQSSCGRLLLVLMGRRETGRRGFHETGHELIKVADGFKRIQGTVRVLTGAYMCDEIVTEGRIHRGTPNGFLDGNSSKEACQMGKYRGGQ